MTVTEVQQPRVVKTILPGLLYMAPNPDKWRNREAGVAWLRANVEHVVVLSNRNPSFLKKYPEVGYWHYPIKDGHTALDVRLYEVVTPAVAQWLADGEPTLIACLVGRSRSGAACALAVREHLNLTGRNALALVRKGRPNAVKRAGPEAELNALRKPR